MISFTNARRVLRGGGGGGGGSSGVAVGPDTEIPDDHVPFKEPIWPPNDGHSIALEIIDFIIYLLCYLFMLYLITFYWGYRHD